MLVIKIKIKLLLAAFILQCLITKAQTNLLLNGGFEDVNTCTEYNSECGVEGWFYLKDVKAQMLSNEINSTPLGSNSFGIFYNWQGYTDFIPIIGAILPCNLKKDNRYTFKGIISAKLNQKLILKPGICTGEKFYVPRRSFAKGLKPDSIITIKKIPNTIFYEFEYSFIANGKERFLTFGTYIQEDTIGAKKKLIGTQTVSLVLDNFQLIPENEKETICTVFDLNKKTIYDYNFRHKEMDYSLFGRGDLNIIFNAPDSNFTTQIKEPEPPAPKTDTLKLSDVLFDFNKATLKPDAIKTLAAYFKTNNSSIDSIYVEGHTDSLGTDARNLQLSQQRSESVKNWLLQNNISTADKIQIHPFGKWRPVASNKTSQGRAQNRRVEMIILRKLKK